MWLCVKSGFKWRKHRMAKKFLLIITVPTQLWLQLMPFSLGKYTHQVDSFTLQAMKHLQNLLTIASGGGFRDSPRLLQWLIFPNGQSPWKAEIWKLNIKLSVNVFLKTKAQFKKEGGEGKIRCLIWNYSKRDRINLHNHHMDNTELDFCHFIQSSIK